MFKKPYLFPYLWGFLWKLQNLARKNSSKKLWIWILIYAKEHNINQLEVLKMVKEPCMCLKAAIRLWTFWSDGRWCLFLVSRRKKKAVICEVSSFSLPNNCTILFDKMVYIGTTKNAQKMFSSPWSHGYKGKSASFNHKSFWFNTEEISEIYRSCWVIELFFKWMNQHVEMK